MEHNFLTHVQLESIIKELVERVSSMDWGKEYVRPITELLEMLGSPCKLAIAGQVSAGKSSLVNILLDTDLAIVGASETTAVLTYFVYGENEDLGRIKCFFKDGKVDFKDIGFLDKNQGTDQEMLREISEIERIEVYCQNPLLRNITIIDTPGTGSVEDAHETKARQILNDADAILYLFEYVGNIHNEEYLDSFKRMTGYSENLMNTIGVITKIDQDYEVLLNPKKLTTKLEKQFAGSVNCVLSISAYLYEMIRSFPVEKLNQIGRTLQKIPEDEFNRIMKSYGLYTKINLKSNTVDLEERKVILNYFTKKGCEWITFKQIARLLYESKTDNPKQEILYHSGFPLFIKALHTQIVDRANHIKDYQLALQLKGLLSRMLKLDLVSIGEEEIISDRRKERFIEFLSSFSNDVARDLLSFVKSSKELDYPVHKRIHWIGEIILKIEHIISNLEILNKDLMARLLIPRVSKYLTNSEVLELSALLGKGNVEFNLRIDDVEELGINDFYQRKFYWKSKSQDYRSSSAMSRLMRIASDRYDYLISIKKMHNE